VIGCAALLVPILGGKEGGLMASPRPLHYGVSPCLHTRFLVFTKFKQNFCKKIIVDIVKNKTFAAVSLTLQKFIVLQIQNLVPLSL
jgi:hypothetical protein